MTTATTHTVDLRPDLPITLTEAGSGRPALVLHGGGGPFTVAGIAEHLAVTMHAITPTHPGWNGTPRPDSVSSIDDIALAYLGYLEDNDLRDVLVVGSSLGGWIGAEMASRDDAGRISGLILFDAVGVDVDGQRIRDFFALDARGSPTTHSTTPIATTWTRSRYRRSKPLDSAPTWPRCGSSPARRICTTRRCSIASDRSRSPFWSSGAPATGS